MVRDGIAIEELAALARARFGDFVKAVVDVKRRIMVVGGQLHADQEQILLDDGSAQADLWGINLDPAEPADQWIEYDSMINLRPALGNMGRDIEDPRIREEIEGIVRVLVRR